MPKEPISGDEGPPSLAAVRAVVEATPEPRFVVAADERILMMNAAACALLGYEYGELVGLPYDVLTPPGDGDKVDDLRAEWADAPQQGALGRGMDLRARRRDGTDVPIEVCVAPVDTAEGLIGIVSVRDLTEVEHDTRLFRGLLESAPDAVVIVDDAGRIRLVNATLEKWFGYTRDELVGQSIEVLVPQRSARKHEGLRRSYVGHPHSRPLGLGGELSARRKDGSEFPVEISLAPVHTDDGLLIVADLRDITDRLAVIEAMRKAEERQRIQEETNRVKDAFFATVSHELRTPLASIVGYTELMADIGDLSPESQRWLAVIARNADRELQLVDDLLTLVSIDEHGLRVEFVPVDLGALADETVSAQRPAAHARGIELSFVSCDHVQMIDGDRRRLGQALNNLLSNALKFTPEGGQVQVVLSTMDHRARIDVIDTGIGIGEVEPGHLFERLYRGKNAVAREIPGAGLGLPIALAIVEAHFGTVRVVESNEHGTTFRVELPVANGRAPGAAPGIAVPGQRQSSGT